jgi:hypothetical protein
VKLPMIASGGGFGDGRSLNAAAGASATARPDELGAAEE